jgi:sentrin-specific protease 1
MKYFEKLFKSWEKKKLNLLKFDNILMPININNIHWSLVSIDLHNKAMTYYDSLRFNSGDDYMETLTYIFDEYLKRFNKDEEANKLSATMSTYNNKIDFNSDDSGDEISFHNDWAFTEALEIPLQKNTYDCGVFLCKFMEYISRREEICFSQCDMSYFRLLIATEILEGKLLTT